MNKKFAPILFGKNFLYLQNLIKGLEKIFNNLHDWKNDSRKISKFKDQKKGSGQFHLTLILNKKFPRILDRIKGVVKFPLTIKSKKKFLVLDGKYKLSFRQTEMVNIFLKAQFISWISKQSQARMKNWWEWLD